MTTIRVDLAVSCAIAVFCEPVKKEITFRLSSEFGTNSNAVGGKFTAVISPTPYKAKFTKRYHATIE